MCLIFCQFDYFVISKYGSSVHHVSLLNSDQSLQLPSACLYLASHVSKTKLGTILQNLIFSLPFFFYLRLTILLSVKSSILMRCQEFLIPPQNSTAELTSASLPPFHFFKWALSSNLGYCDRLLSDLFFSSLLRPPS